jgi:LmbE family N-acetylglucosaminyl deacetylase
MNVVAHEDDDILFLNPDVQNDIAVGSCIRTVYLTAGDSGQAPEYWSGREQGAKAAYAAMFGVDDVWQDEYQQVAGKLVIVSHLKTAPNVALVFLHLPDGNIHGEGFPSTGAESLAKLLAGEIPVIHTVDNKATYTKDQLVAVLSSIMKTDVPDRVRTQNPHGQADGDHADHEAAGTLATLASDAYTVQHTLATYAGYPEMLLDPNLTTEQISGKQIIFLTYAKHDTAVCQTPEDCAATMTYGNYLTRQYKLTEVLSGQPVSVGQ